MPTTINGVGTHYYGRKDVSTREGTCESCRRSGTLTSYDTRLWFVVIFVPLIPLGRKRIIDRCRYCSRHRVADAAAYEQARHDKISEAVDQYQADPTPVGALNAHAMMLAFRQRDQAAKFRSSALARFPGDAPLRAAMASHLEEISGHDETGPLYEDAYAIDPSLPAAKVGVAHLRMADGELDEARRLLKFLETPGAGREYSLYPIDALSTLYQKTGRHEEAMQLARHLLTELPDAGNEHKFRRFVQRSEKALGTFDSILPPRANTIRGLFFAQGSPYSSRQRSWAIGSVVVTLLAAGLVGSNEYIRRHRTVYVVNATGQPVVVRVDGGPPEAITDFGKLAVAEGPHTFAMSGPVAETRQIEVASGYFGRWFNTPLWVLNPGGEAVLEVSTLIYAADPPPNESSLVIGVPFYERPDVDFPFTTPPDKISVKGSSQVRKTQVEWFHGPDTVAFQSAIDANPGPAMDFAERRLRRQVDPALLKAYLGHIKAGTTRRVEAYLKEGLGRRPVVMDWHRAYQSLADRNRPEAPLAAEYDAYLAADPTNGSLLYLRGRVDPDWQARGDYNKRSAEADPTLAWPWLGLASRAAAGARWRECLDLLAKARERQVDEETIADLEHTARLGLGEAPALVDDYRRKVQARPLDLQALVRLNDALAASGKPAEIEPAVFSWLAGIPGPARPRVSPLVHALGAYQAGRLDEALSGGIVPFGSSPSLKPQAMLAMGRAVEVAADPTLGANWTDPWATLSVAVGLSLAAKPQEAADWRSRAAATLSTQTRDDRLAACALSSTEPTELADIEHIGLDPDDRALLLVALADKFPARKAEYLAAAARYNLGRKPPYLLVRLAIEGGGPK